MLDMIRVPLPSETAVQMGVVLTRFGLEDIPVVGRAKVLSMDREPTPIHEAMTGTTELTQLCAQANLWREHCVPRNRFKFERVAGTIEVLCRNELIGTIDPNDVFSYSAAPDLRTCLGWVVATDQGRRQHSFEYDLDGAVHAINQSLQTLGNPSAASRQEVMKVYYEGEFGNAIRANLRQGYGSRLIGGCIDEAKNVIWRVATRTLFYEEHPGFILSID